MKISLLSPLVAADMDGTETVPVVKGGKSWRALLSDLGMPFVSAARAARDEAQAARSATATIAASLPLPLYASAAAAQADATLLSGKLFLVVSGTQILIFTKQSSTASTAYGVIPTATYVDRLKSRVACPTVDYGAVGDGNSPVADQAGFAAAVAAAIASVKAPLATATLVRQQIGILLEPGVYDAGGFAFGSAPITFKARIPGTVLVRIPAGQYFATQNSVNVLLEGIIFSGGLGAYRSTSATASSAYRADFLRCDFYSYTECAISNNGVDSPFLKVKNCRLYGGLASGNQVIGVAWGGFVDELVLEDNACGGNSFHFAIGPRLSGHASIMRNYFQSGDNTALNGTRCLADIWIKGNLEGETNSGQGTYITHNKFGNELASSAYPAPRILIASEDTTTGSYRAQYKPSTADTGVVSGLQIYGNRINHVQPWAAPFIRSYSSNIRYWDVWGNIFTGGSPTYFVEFMNPRSGTDYSNNNSTFEVKETSGANITNSGTPVLFSNALFCQLRDFACLWPGDPNSVPVYPVSDDPTLAVANMALSAYEMSFLSGTTSVAAADPYGTREYATVTSGGAYIGFTDPNAGAGGPVFIEAAVSKAAANALTQVMVVVINTATATYALKRTMALPANGTFGKIALPINLPSHASPSTWQFQIYGINSVSGSADSFICGDMIASRGHGRMGRARALDRFPGTLPRNRTLMGGAQGTLPTGWATGTANGLAGITVTINDVGLDEYGWFVEIALSGTATVGGVLNIFPEMARIMMMKSGNAWRAFAGIRLISGDMTGLTSQTGYDGSTGPFAWLMGSYSAVNVNQINRGVCFTPTTAYMPVGRTFTSSGGYFNSGAAYGRPVLAFSIAVGAAPTAVFRFYNPDLKRVA